MRILFISQEYPPETGWGGIGTYLYAISHALVKRGHEVHVLSAVVGQYHSHRIDDGVYVHRVGQFELKGLWKLGFASTLYRLQTALSNYLAFRSLGLKFDIVETTNVRAEGLILLFMHNRPLMITHYHGKVLSEVLRDPRVDVHVAQFLENLCLARADHVTFATRDSVADADCRLDLSRVSIIPHPVSWDPGRDTRAGDAPPQVLFSGRFEPVKNPRIIVEAVPLVLRRIPSAQFVFVGREPSWARGYLESLKSLADRSGVSHAVQFTDWLDANGLSAVRAASRVCVVPSLRESFGFTAAECMAAGRPVIASRVAGLREVVVDGTTGKLVDPNDHTAWANAITDFLGDPDLATRLGDSGRTEARQNYSPEIAAIRREEVYRTAIEKHQSKRAIGAALLT